MLIAEARELGAILEELPASAFPLANIGSQSSDFRMRTQPWIYERVFEPVERAGNLVVNIDVADSDGVDIVADATTAAGQQAIHSAGTRSVMCSNLLEHVTSIDGTLKSLSALVDPAGFLIVSGPLRYPFHPDPIDNGFRPTSREMSQLLPKDLEVVFARDVTCRRLIRYDFARLVKLLSQRGRKHSSSDPQVITTRWSAPRLASRAAWTIRRPSCYIVVARKRAGAPQL